MVHVPEKGSLEDASDDATPQIHNFSYLHIFAFISHVAFIPILLYSELCVYVSINHSLVLDCQFLEGSD